MGRRKDIGFLIAALTVVMYIAFGMDYANTFHDFQVNFMGQMNPNQLADIVGRGIVNFFMQPVPIAGTFSLPLIAVLIIAIGLVHLVKRKFA